MITSLITDWHPFLVTSASARRTNTTFSTQCQLDTEGHCHCHHAFPPRHAASPPLPPPARQPHPPASPPTPPPSRRPLPFLPAYPLHSPSPPLVLPSLPLTLTLSVRTVSFYFHLYLICFLASRVEPVLSVFTFIILLFSSDFFLFCRWFHPFCHFFILYCSSPAAMPG